MRNYTLEEKIAALDALNVNGHKFRETAAQLQIPLRTLQAWEKEAERLRIRYLAQLTHEAARLMADAQIQLARKTQELIRAMDAARIENASLSQVSNSLGIVIDRYLKLAGTGSSAEQVVRFEFQQPDGRFSPAPPWATDDSEGKGPLQGGGLRAPLRENGAGQNGAHPAGDAVRPSNVVAGPHLWDSEPGMAGSEEDADESLWYQDQRG